MYFKLTLETTEINHKTTALHESHRFLVSRSWVSFPLFHSWTIGESAIRFFSKLGSNSDTPAVARAERGKKIAGRCFRPAYFSSSTTSKKKGWAAAHRIGGGVIGFVFIPSVAEYINALGNKREWDPNKQTNEPKQKKQKWVFLYRGR